MLIAPKGSMGQPVSPSPDPNATPTSTPQVTIPQDTLVRAGLKVGDRLRAEAGRPGELILICEEDPADRFAGALTGAFAPHRLDELRPRMALTILDAGVALSPAGSRSESCWKRGWRASLGIGWVGRVRSTAYRRLPFAASPDASRAALIAG
jgi:bifunctional DNA-binding transcriptional regulator/antitoxin component of YhaV-PrlF toxin-antitoxin module